MLKSIKLKTSESTSPLNVDAEGVTIFVGPNNSGKSLVLRELEVAIATHGKRNGLLLDDFELKWPTDEMVESDLGALKSKTPKNLPMGQMQIQRWLPNGSAEANTIHEDTVREMFKSKTDKYWICSQFLQFLQIRLDGRTRFDLTNDKGAGDLSAAPANNFAHIFQDDNLREELRAVIYEAFGLYFVIDPTNMGSLRIKLSEVPPTFDEQSLNKAARDFYAAAQHVKQASDGVQAFIGITVAVRAGDYRLVLVDEPEAFLHPPLARKLGHHLASIVAKRGGCLMASTHSSDFLLGCLQGNPNVRVVRLEYSKGKSKAKIVDPHHLTTFMKTPLMRSANVVSALFYDGVIVTESDNDRVFYSEIYLRISEGHDSYPSILFVNAQNKQTIRSIIEPLRKFGVPAVAVTDIDILKDGGKTWTGWLESAQIPSTLHGSLGQARGDICAKFQSSNKDMKRDGGVNCLDLDGQEAANDLFDKLEEYGIFATRRGELEDWLRSLGVPGRKTDWTIAMLDALGSDSKNPNYIRPQEGDVWDFIGRSVKWIQNTSRKGLA